MTFKDRVQLAVSLAVDGNPTPLIDLYLDLSKKLGHDKAAEIIQRHAIEVFQ